jgi:hypothetical protein
MRLPLIAALLLAAGCENLPIILPSGFGGPAVDLTQVHVDFPSGLAVTPNGTLLVANGNFSHATVGGTMFSISKSTIETLMFDPKNAAVDCSAPLLDANGQIILDATGKPTFASNCLVQPSDPGVIQSAVMIGNYAGPIALDDDASNPASFLAGGAGGTAFTGSRDSNTLDAVHVDPDGTLTCLPAPGISPIDCRQGLMNTSTTIGSVSGLVANLDGPYSIVPGDAALPGHPSQRVMFVASLVPHVESIQNGIPITTSEVSVLDMANPSNVLFTMFGSSIFLTAGVGMGIGPMLYDPVRRHLYLGGCYERFGGTGSGEPATSKCVNVAFNLLRTLTVDARENAVVAFYDLFADVQSIDTSSMVFADLDPSTQTPTTIWATMRNPDVLVKIALPLDQSIAPRARLIVPMPSFPSELVVIPRTQQGKGDLIAVASERTGAVTIYDTDAGQVVANVERVGDTPHGLKLYENLPDGINPDGSTNPNGPVARLVSAVFAGCSLAFIEVPLNNPENAQLRGRIGECEE